jgi:hypothetical protein
MNLCIYSEIFGIPNKGIHKYRLFNLAIVDVIFTIIGGYLLHHFFIKNLYPKIKLWQIIIILFIFGIIMHRIFCVKTTIDKLLFK